MRSLISKLSEPDVEDCWSSSKGSSGSVLNNYRVGKLKKLVLVLRFVPEYGKPADTLGGGGNSRFSERVDRAVL